MLRQVRPGLIGGYCRSRGLALGVDVTSLGKDALGVLARAMVAIPHDQQAVIDTDFARIAHLACRAGPTVLLDLARERTSSLADELATCKTHQERAMHVFVKQRSLFAEAEARMLMDGASQRRWKRCYVAPKLVRVRSAIHSAVGATLSAAWRRPRLSTRPAGTAPSC